MCWSFVGLIGVLLAAFGAIEFVVCFRHVCWAMGAFLGPIGALLAACGVVLE